MIPIAEISGPVIAAIAAGMLSGGLVSAVANWRKSGPEADQIVSRTLIEVNEHLRQELELRDREIDRLRRRLSTLRKDFDALAEELQKLSERETPSAPK